MTGLVITYVALGLSVGLNGLLIALHKLAMTELEADDDHIETLKAANEELRNKLTPWNKGKAGTYKKKKTTAIPSSTPRQLTDPWIVRI